MLTEETCDSQATNGCFLLVEVDVVDGRGRITMAVAPGQRQTKRRKILAVARETKAKGAGAGGEETTVRAVTIGQSVRLVREGVEENGIIALANTKANPVPVELVSQNMGVSRPGRLGRQGNFALAR